jgi:hypothetical protein
MPLVCVIPPEPGMPPVFVSEPPCVAAPEVDEPAADSPPLFVAVEPAAPDGVPVPLPQPAAADARNPSIRQTALVLIRDSSTKCSVCLWAFPPFFGRQTDNPDTYLIGFR